MAIPTCSKGLLLATIVLHSVLHRSLMLQQLAKTKMIMLSSRRLRSSQGPLTPTFQNYGNQLLLKQEHVKEQHRSQANAVALGTAEASILGKSRHISQIVLESDSPGQRAGHTQRVGGWGVVNPVSGHSQPQIMALTALDSPNIPRNAHRRSALGPE